MGDASGKDQRQQEIDDLRTQLEGERSASSKQLTQWAEYRTLLANERTLGAWLRTGLSSIAVGLAIADLISSGRSPLIPRVIGILLVILGTVASIFAFWRFDQVTHVLISEDIGAGSRRVLGGMVALLLVIAALVLWLIFSSGQPA